MNRERSFFRVLGKLEGLPVAAVLALLFLAFFLAAPNVFSGSLIYMSFLQTVPPLLILGLGLTLVITAGEIDLSFPAITALSAFVFTWFFKHLGQPVLGFILALGAGGLAGYINGLWIARVRVPSIMATLAAQFFWYGVTVLLANGLQIDILEIRGTPIHTIFAGRLFGIVPTEALWALGLTVLFWFILNRHKFGEAIMFIGDNPDVARVMGINVEVTRIKLFTLNGVLAAFAGLLVTLEQNVFYPAGGKGFLLPVMAAVFIGGTSIAGGYGAMFGTFFGSYIIGSLEAGVVATGIAGYWVSLVEGTIMAASISLNVVIEDGRLSRILTKIRHWSVPERTGGGGAPPRIGGIGSK